MTPVPPVPAAPATARARFPARGRPGRLAVLCITAGLVTVGIEEYVFPTACQQLLRDWVMHFTAVVAVTLGVGLVLGVATEIDGARRRMRLAVLVPFVFLALHELGQWTWPDGARDPFDSLRDLGLNGIGTLVAWRLLRSARPTTHR